MMTLVSALLIVSQCFQSDLFLWGHSNMDDESKRVLAYLTEIEEAAEDVLSTKQQVIHSQHMAFIKGQSGIKMDRKKAKRVSREDGQHVARLVRDAMLV